MPTSERVRERLENPSLWLLENAPTIFLKKRGMLFCSLLVSDSNGLELILKCKDSKAGGGVLGGCLAPINQRIYFTRGKKW